MSFNRLKYDNCEKKQYMIETTKPCDYYIKQPLVSATCYQDNPSIRLQKSGVSMDGSKEWRYYSGPVDVESELKNITRPSSRCPSKKYIPKCSECNHRYQGQTSGADSSNLCKECTYKKGKYGNKQIVDFPKCHFPVQYTRLNNCPQREVSVNRFEYPCLNPQKNIFFPGRIQVSTRLVIKDKFTSCKNKR